MLRGKIAALVLGVVCAVSVTVSPVQVKAAVENAAVVESQESATLADGVYTVKNNTRYVNDNALGKTMARKVVADTTKVEVKDGKTFFTVSLTGNLYSFLSQFTASVDGNAVVVTVDAKAKAITFEVPSVDSEVLLGMYVSKMKRSVNFYLTNDVTTLAQA